VGEGELKRWKRGEAKIRDQMGENMEEKVSSTRHTTRRCRAYLAPANERPPSRKQSKQNNGDLEQRDEGR
jgi:hypothetical protein